MLTARQLLIKQTAEAFRGRADMPLMASHIRTRRNLLHIREKKA
jgi:hypothetical protein